MIWSFARDEVLPASRILVKLSKAEAQPIYAIIVTTIIGAFVYLISATDVYSVLVTFTAGGYYLAFLFPLLTGLVARLRGQMGARAVEPRPVGHPGGGAGGAVGGLRVHEHRLAPHRVRLLVHQLGVPSWRWA